MMTGIFSNTFSRVFILILVATALAGGVYVYTASNTVPDVPAGEGQGTISGFVVSTVHYGLNTTDPTKIDQVTFALDSAPASGSTLRAKLVSSGSTWYSCTNIGTAVTCNTTSPQATVSTANQLSVVVAQ